MSWQEVLFWNNGTSSHSVCQMTTDGAGHIPVSASECSKSTTDGRCSGLRTHTDRMHAPMDAWDTKCFVIGLELSNRVMSIYVNTAFPKLSTLERSWTVSSICLCRAGSFIRSDVTTTLSMLSTLSSSSMMEVCEWTHVCWAWVHIEICCVPLCLH